MPYIYKITNMINGKMYIGKTSHSTIEERMKEHLLDSRRDRCAKRPLYDAFSKYGEENFKIEMIEKVNNDQDACVREMYWIDYYRTYIGFKDCKGYNATLGGDSYRLYNYRALADAYLKLNSIVDVCSMFQCDCGTVKKALQEYGIVVNPNYNSKKIKRIDCDGNSKIYNSITEAAMDIPNKNVETARKNINRSLCSLYKKSKAYGYKWCYI